MTSTNVAERGSRASQQTIGIFGLRSSAARTSSGSYRYDPSNSLTATTNDVPRRSKKSSAGKQSSSLRVSARTTAPNAPSDNSFHMNQNRSWPGVPNRYRICRWSSVIRPKSRATVVVSFSPKPVRSSVPMLAVVMVSSVLSGSISLTAPTNVVFPTPKPPATRSLMAVGKDCRGGCAGDWSESPL